jgi:hypothetical protein
MTKKTTKSILDNVPVDDQAFPLGKKELSLPPPGNRWGIVSYCPKCNAPIYGRHDIAPTDTEPLIRRTCSCFVVTPDLPAPEQKTIQDTLRTT